MKSDQAWDHIMDAMEERGISPEEISSFDSLQNMMLSPDSSVEHTR